LKGLGYRLIHETPKDGADNKRIAFLHPKSTNSVLVELCEEKK
jgi:methylmalonyl-CoA/ethylmalonyl-CoA epimerase